jgi:hypothetical protein
VLYDVNQPPVFEGRRVVVVPDVPCMELGTAPCVAGGEVIAWVSPEVRAETNAWLRAFFGTTNFVRDDWIIRDDVHGTILMNPRTLAKLRAANAL